ncbi:hypothetical protein HBI12_112800 [Parastagonospora nodorum]|nr:hypothetical protein HBI12_112800 [Parastagonospora nodorum]KAH5424793.1 hypothetical protein HBI47_123580 [Parastagonospora nodorum]
MSLDVYVAFSKRRGDDPLHWMLLVAPSGSDRCTWYHVTGGPTQGKGYTLEIQANKRVNSQGIGSKELVGRIEEKDTNKLKSSAQRVPLQRCQRWTCDLLEDLERKGLIAEGTSAQLRGRIEPSRHESSA